MGKPSYVTVARVGDVPVDGVRAVEVGDESILLCNSGERIFAVINQCSHAQEALACGRVREGWIACPAHGACFDLETGEALKLPATEPIRTFPVRITDGAIEILV